MEESDFEYKTGATSLQLTSNETNKYINGSRSLVLKKTEQDNVTFYKGTMNRTSTTQVEQHHMRIQLKILQFKL